MNKLDLYQKYIKQSFYNFIELCEISKNLDWEMHKQNNRHLPHSLEISVPRQVGKSRALAELAEQYQKVFYVAPNMELIHHMFGTRHNLKHYLKFGTEFISMNNLKRIIDSVRGLDISNYIFILDEVSISDFIEKADPLVLGIIHKNSIPIFSVTTPRLSFG